MAKSIFTADQLISVYGQPQNVDSSKSIATKPKRDILQKTGDVVNKIFPGGKVGESIGTLAGYGVTAAKEKLGLAPKGSTEQYDLSAPTPLQTAGDVAQGALTVAGLKAPLPATTGARIAQTAGLGAGLSASEGIAEGESAGQVAKDAITGAVVGGLTQGAFEALPAVSKWLGKQANNLRKSSFRLTPTEKLKLNDKVDDVVTFLKEKNISGSPEQQYKGISDYYNNAEKVIQGSIKETGKTYTRQELVDDVLKIPEKYTGEIDNPEVYDQLTSKSNKLANYIKNTLGNKFGDAIPADKLNDLKRQYMKNGFNKAGDAMANEASLTIGDELYKKILADIPEIQSLNKEYSNIITARKILGKALGRNELGTFGNLVALGVGGGAGSAIGGVPGAIVGTIAARPVAKKIAGTAAKTAIAGGTEKVSQALAKAKGSKIPRIITKLTD